MSRRGRRTRRCQGIQWILAMNERETQYDIDDVMYYGYGGYVEGKADRTRL